jgi:DNA-binding transcriptional LysR family regulator
MAAKKKILPPLDYLLAFEAAASRESIALASKEMHISETAISRKIRLLELHYGVAFFERGQRSIALTERGRSFLEQIRPALQSLRTTSRRMLASEEDRKPITLAATNSVASLWLMPRLREFNRSNPHNIMLVASDSDEECLAEAIDLAILRGDGRWPGFSATLLFGETVFPVCSPDYLAANPGATKIAKLPQLALIEVASHHTEWMNWQTWMQLNGVVDTRVRRASLFNTYPLSIEAAVDGLGVALGWAHLVDRLIDAGKLVRPLGSASVRTEHGYYLLQHEDGAPTAEGKAVKDWLLTISAARKRYDGEG